MAQQFMLVATLVAMVAVSVVSAFGQFGPYEGE